MNHAPAPRTALTPTPAGGPPNTNSGAASQQAILEKRGPVEFNHAISYVNKIKVGNYMSLSFPAELGTTAFIRTFKEKPARGRHVLGALVEILPTANRGLESLPG
jgi:hypothetical protein